MGVGLWKFSPSRFMDVLDILNRPAVARLQEFINGFFKSTTELKLDLDQEFEGSFVVYMAKVVTKDDRKGIIMFGVIEDRECLPHLELDEDSFVDDNEKCAYEYDTTKRMSETMPKTLLYSTWYLSLAMLKYRKPTMFDGYVLGVCIDRCYSVFPCLYTDATMKTEVQELDGEPFEDLTDEEIPHFLEMEKSWNPQQVWVKSYLCLWFDFTGNGKVQNSVTGNISQPSVVECLCE